MSRPLTVLSEINEVIDELKKKAGLEEITLEKLVEELYKHPIGSYDYQMIRLGIIDKLDKEKYDEYLIAFPSRMNKEYDKINEKLEFFNSINGITRAIQVTETEATCIFSNELSFLDEPDTFIFERRRFLEFNPTFKQLVVGCYITDGRRIILLRTHKDGKTRIKDKYTLVQGHVSFDEYAYIMSQTNFLRENMRRELEEETNWGDFKLTLPLYPKFLINDTKNFVGLEHFGVIYEIELKEDIFDKVAESLTTKEKDKHDVVVLTIYDLRYNSEHYRQLDEWMLLVMDKILGEIY
jgi:predicted NUDIX family phosphoesterase